MRDYSGRCKHGHATLYQAIRLDKGSSGMGEEGNGRREEGDKKVECQAHTNLELR